MEKLQMSSAGISVQEIDLSGPRKREPAGVPAGIIGTAQRGRAFVPVTIGTIEEWKAVFGESDGKMFGPLAVAEWLRNAQSATYIRVLGAGDGKKRSTSGNTAGSVTNAGFVVGEQLPNSVGSPAVNPYANGTAALGRMNFLVALMSASTDSTFMTDASIPQMAVTSSAPIVRGIIMVPSGVALMMSSSVVSSGAPSATGRAGKEITGSLVGTVNMLDSNGVSMQEFVLLLNGHKGTDASYPNVITASFDPTAVNYMSNVLNTDPLKIQQAGHYLYAHYPIHPAVAVVTGTGWVPAGASVGYETAAFLATGSLARNVGSATVPNFENFEDRFNAPISPWVISQKFGGAPINLFKIEALDDGMYSAGKLKISIENIAASSDTDDKYGTFDIIVRDMDDTDDDQIVYEEWRGLSLDPSSERFIGKVIGDQKLSYDFDRATGSQKLKLEGSFPNMSNWIRVSLDTNVENGESNSDALPMGFRGYPHLMVSGSDPLCNVPETTATTASAFGLVTNGTTRGLVKRVVQPPIPFRRTISTGTSTKREANASFYWGVKFEQTIDVEETNKSNAHDEIVDNMSKYLPNFMTTTMDVVEGSNNGTSDTAANGIIDADRYCNNLFTLENVQVVTGTDGKPDPDQAKLWTYMRTGSIAANAVNKTRALAATDLTRASTQKYAKFSFFLQGGFDGTNIFDDDEARLTNEAAYYDMQYTARGQQNGCTVASWSKAIDIMKETSDVDIQLLAIPGMKTSTITDKAVQAVEDRFDAMFVMDIDSYDNLNSLVTSSVDQIEHVANTVSAFLNRNLDSSFAAAYYPDVFIRDVDANKVVQVPPSVAVMGALALNDAIGYPWFAPAGFSRGALKTTEDVAVRLTRDNMDQLYEADINPIVAFPGSAGPVVWGQKTLQQAKTSLDRVNVRRMLIDVRRKIRKIGNTFVFEPNRPATLAKFENACKPVLQDVQSKSGVNRYKVRIDTTTTSNIDIQNLTIRGKLWLEPTRTVEFVSLDFIVSNQGATVT